MSSRSIRRRHEREVRRGGRRRRVATAAGIVSAGAAIAPGAAQAANFTVTNTNDAGAGSLRAAILAANATPGVPDVITFSGAGASGTIRLTTGEIPITDDLTITGPGAGQLAISGDADNDGNPDFDDGVTADSRIFAISDATSPGSPLMDVTISGLRFEEGVASEFAGTPQPRSGGAIYAQQTDLTLTNTTFAGNVASEDGGAVYLTGDGTTGAEIAALHVSGSQFTGNRARIAGGAISSRPVKYGSSAPDEAVTTITNSQITGNRAGGTDFGPFTYATGPSGGGVVATKYEATIEGSTIANNVARTDYAGGVGGTGGGVITGGVITNSTIRGNTAGDIGGGVRLRGGKIRSSTVSGNTAGETGGGIITSGSKYGPSRVDSSTISGNSALGVLADGDGGGGVASYGYSSGAMQLVIRNSTIASNTTTGIGGGIQGFAYQEPEEAQVELKGTIVADNTANGGASDLGTDSPAGVSTAKLFAVGFSLIEAPRGVPLNGDPNGSNITAVDPQLGPLAANGGATETHALAATSPAVDASQAFGFTTDQRGSPRTTDARASNSPLSDGTDIGAYELQDGNAPGDDDVTKPTAKITKAPKSLKLKKGKETARAKVKFKGSDDRTAADALSFECKLDKGKFEPCSSPLKLKLDKGRHKLQVRAIDAAGNASKAAKAKIKVKAASRPKKK